MKKLLSELKVKLESGKSKTRKLRKRRNLFSEFSSSQFLIFSIRSKSKSQKRKSRKKISNISDDSEVSEFSTWPKQHIQNIKNDNELSNDPQIKWEFLKYQIRKFTIRFSKMRAKEERKQREESTLKLCQWYEEGEKSCKFIFNLEKFNGVQSQIRQIIVNDQEITDPNTILNEIRNFCEFLFKKVTQNVSSKLMIFLIRFTLQN